MHLTRLASTFLIPALALAPAQTPTTAPTLKVYSRETIVDVTVTDSKGNPVHGLTQSDFTVKEDHKPQSIRSFHEYTTEPQPALSKLPPNTYTNLQPPPTSGAVNVMLLDFLNIAAMPAPEISGAGDALGRAIAAQKAVKQEAKKYVASMPAGTRLMVLGLSNNLRTLQGFTSDPALLSASLDTLGYNTEGRAATYEQYCMQAEMRTRMTLEVVDQIAADLSAISGKKNLLWFSVGIPWLTDASAHPQCLPDYSSDLLKTYGLLAAAQITIDPIDARGVTTMPDAFITSTGQLFHFIPGLPWPTPGAINAFLQLSAEEKLSMESIAEATGGTAYYNSNDLAAITAKAIDSGSYYYTLTYAPPGQKYDYAHHAIDIAVDKPGLHLVYRKTYDAVDPSTIKPPPGLTLTTTPPEVVAGNMSAAMSRSMPTSQNILFDVQVEPSTTPPNPADPPILGTLDPTVKAKLKGKPLTRYGFSYSIPAAQLTFTPGPGNTHKGLVELDLAAFDTDGKLVTGLSQTVTMPLTDARYQQFIKGPFRFAQQIDLPPGQLFLRIGVLDRTSNKAGTLEIPLTVPKASK